MKAMPYPLVNAPPMPIFEHLKSLVYAPDYFSVMNQQIFCENRGKTERGCRREWARIGLSYKSAEHRIRKEVAIIILAEPVFNVDNFAQLMGYSGRWAVQKFVRDVFGMSCLQYRYKYHGLPGRMSAAVNEPVFES